jgi:hypothetical protein
VIGKIDVLGRLAYGLLCIAGMTLEAIPVLMIVGVIGGIGLAVDGNYDRAVYVWLGSWGAAGISTLIFVLIVYVFWPRASDWITEWMGYVTALIIAAGGLGTMSIIVKFTDWPLAVELIVPLVITFLAGFSIPGWFLGLDRSMPTIRDRPRRRITATKR